MNALASPGVVKFNSVLLCHVYYSAKEEGWRSNLAFCHSVRHSASRIAHDRGNGHDWTSLKHGRHGQRHDPLEVTNFWC